MVLDGSEAPRDLVAKVRARAMALCIWTPGGRQLEVTPEDKETVGSLKKKLYEIINKEAQQW